MQIKQISATMDNGGSAQIFGLGEDNQVYFWNPESCQWILMKQ